MINNFSNETTEINNENFLIEEIKERNKILKYTLNTLIFTGSFSFLIVGLSSYLRFNILPFLNASEIIFFPQGIIMSFYGIIGLILSINQILILHWKTGEGYNEFNRKKGTMTIFRKGFPGKNSDIKIIYPLDDILRN